MFNKMKENAKLWYKDVTGKNGIGWFFFALIMFILCTFIMPFTVFYILRGLLKW